MNKWQIICPVVAMLVVGIVFGSIHMRGDRRALVLAVTQQIDAHASQIVNYSLRCGAAMPSSWRTRLSRS